MSRALPADTAHISHHVCGPDPADVYEHANNSAVFANGNISRLGCAIRNIYYVVAGPLSLPYRRGLPLSESKILSMVIQQACTGARRSVNAAE